MLRMLYSSVAIALIALVSSSYGFVPFEGNVKIPSFGDKGEAWCEMCELVMDRVEALIKEKDNEGKVNATLYDLCDLLNNVAKKECYDMVPTIKKQLTQDFDTKKACTMLQFCGTSRHGAEKVLKFTSEMNSGKKNQEDIWEDAGELMELARPFIDNMFYHVRDNPAIPVACFMCKTAVNLVDKSLERYKKPITDYVVGICQQFPPPTNRACADAMNYYIPQWWDDFFSGVASPSALCAKIRMCRRRGDDKSFAPPA